MKIILYISLISLFHIIRNDNITIQTEYGSCQVSRCNKVFCGVEGGSCIRDECVCNKGYTSSNESKLLKCCYKQKKVLIAFLLEFFITFGAGHFYLGNISVGFIKLGVYLIFLILTGLFIYRAIFYPKKTNKKDKNLLLEIIYIFSIILISSVFIAWQVIDNILIILGYYTDTNNIDLDYT